MMKCRPSEYAQIDAAASKADRTVSDFLRLAALHVLEKHVKL
jgi:uncharacterized protein (DUF1778 family)